MVTTAQAMKVKAGYKLTEVGVIPEDWKATPLIGLAAIQHGYGFQSQYFKPFGKYRLTTPGHFYETGGFRDMGEKQKFYEGPLPEGYLLSEGDLIVAMTEQADGLLGSAAIVPISNTYLHNQRLGKVKVLSPNLSTGFLYRVFNSNSYRTKVRETAVGTKVKHTSPSKLLNIPIPLPPSKAEQEAISTVLSDTDALIECLENLIAKKRAIKQATMQQLLTGKVRLPGFSGGWKTTKLGDIGICLRGVSYNGDNDLSLYDTNNTIRLLRSNNIQNTHIIKSDLHFVTSARVSIQQVLQENDILICMANGSKELVGKAGIFRVDDHYSYTFGAFMGCFRTNWVAHPGFVFFLFQTNRYRNYIANLLAGSSINNLKPSDIESINFPFPKFEEQQAIAIVLSDMDAEITALERKRDKVRALKQGMMQELLTGKTRLL